MIRSLLIATAITCSSLFSAAPQANAGTCWYIPASGQSVRGEYCRTNLRYIDGLRVWFVTDGNGVLHRFVFYTDGTVTHYTGNKQTEFEWETDPDGSYRIYWHDGSEFVFIDS